MNDWLLDLLTTIVTSPQTPFTPSAFQHVDSSPERRNQSHRDLLPQESEYKDHREACNVDDDEQQALLLPSIVVGTMHPYTCQTES